MQSIADIIIERLKILSDTDQQEILDAVNDKVQAAAERPGRPGFLERVDAIIREVPEEEWDELPVDGAVNHDHYLYGAPKRH